MAAYDNFLDKIPKNLSKELLKINKSFSYANLAIETLIEIMASNEKITYAITNYNKNNKAFNKLIHNEIYSYIKKEIEAGNTNIIENFLDEIETINNREEAISALKQLSVLLKKCNIILEYNVIEKMITIPKIIIILNFIIGLDNERSNYNNAFNIINDINISSIIEFYCMENNIEVEEPDEKIEEISDDSFHSEDFFRQLIVELHKYPLLNDQETKELIRKAHDGNKYAEEKLVLHNQRLVINFTKKYFSQMEQAELFQEGCIGLIKAIRNFNLEKNVRFSTYAIWWIRQTIVRAIDNQSKSIRIPVHMQDKIRKYNKVEKDIEQLTGIKPTIDVIASELNISLEEAKRIEYARQSVVSLNTIVGDDDGDTELEDFIADDKENPEENAIREHTRLDILNILNQCGLTKKELDVIKHRYGLAGYEPKTLEYVGGMYGVTRERIRQIEARALKKITEGRNSKKLCDFLDNPDKAFEKVIKKRKEKEEAIIEGTYTQVNKYIKPGTKDKKTHLSETKARNLVKVINIPKEEIDKIVKFLPTDYKMLLNRLYDESYNPRPYNENTKDDRLKRSALIKRIYTIMQDLGYKKESKKMIGGYPIWNAFNTTEEDFKVNIFPKIDDDGKAFINKYFDSNFIKKDNPFDKKEYQWFYRRYTARYSNSKYANISKENRKIEKENVKNDNLDKLNKLELIIVMGIISNDNYNIKTIANFLELEESFIINVIREKLFSYKDFLEENKENTLFLARKKDN